MNTSFILSDSSLVQSFSGVRTIFGFGPDISDEHKLLVSLYGYAYGTQYLKSKAETFIISRDPRPTGKALCDALTRGFLLAAFVNGVELKIINLGIITTPLSQTAIRSLNADGGVIITASHNPINHNGFKFLSGISKYKQNYSAPPGALLSAIEMEMVIDFVGDSKNISDFLKGIDKITNARVKDALSDKENETLRVVAERAYLDSIGLDWNITPHCLKPFTLGPALIDPNGGAGSGIDSRVLEHFGVKTKEINAEVGYPEHTIDTDNIDPASGKHTLLRVTRATLRENCHFGIAFDYDADRGNLVLPGVSEDAIIMPQTVAAFNIALALARRESKGINNKPLAIVMSDSTSLVSEKIAKAFGAAIFYVETGEINVVTKIHELREEGYDVPIGVEGSNGGTIFGSATCRDGLQVALAAAIAESDQDTNKAWITKANDTLFLNIKEKDFYTLNDLVASIPVNYNEMLKFNLSISDHKKLKDNVEYALKNDYYQEISSIFTDFRFENYEGINVRENRDSGDGTGGWCCRLTGSSGDAFVFIRGSRTEAGIFRMIIDAENEIAFESLKRIFTSVLDKFINK